MAQLVGIALMFAIDRLGRDWKIIEVLGSALLYIVAGLFILFWAQVAILFVRFVLKNATKLVEAISELPALPFYIAGLVGFVLLFLSVQSKSAIIGALGAGLVAAAFSHWVGPITFPR